MLSTQIRLKLEAIASKIAKHEEVSLEEMTLIQKWANTNRSAYEILQKARRRAINGEPEPESLDGFMDAMNLGFPDPSQHLTNQSDIDDLENFFKAPPWTKRD